MLTGLPTVGQPWRRALHWRPEPAPGGRARGGLGKDGRQVRGVNAGNVGWRFSTAGGVAFTASKVISYLCTAAGEGFTYVVHRVHDCVAVCDVGGDNGG